MLAEKLVELAFGCRLSLTHTWGSTQASCCRTCGKLGQQSQPYIPLGCLGRGPWPHPSPASPLRHGRQELLLLASPGSTALNNDCRPVLAIDRVELRSAWSAQPLGQVGHTGVEGRFGSRSTFLGRHLCTAQLLWKTEKCATIDSGYEARHSWVSSTLDTSLVPLAYPVQVAMHTHMD